MSERELELAMEKEVSSAWQRINSLYATHPPVYKRILLLREIEQDMSSGTFQQTDIYRHV